MKAFVACGSLILIMFIQKTFAQNVGIGEPNPTSKLEVKGPPGTLFNSFLVKDGNDIPLLSVSNMGRLGINLSNPSVPLHVYSSYASEMVRIRGVNPFLSFYDETNAYTGYLWSRSWGLELGTPAGSILPVMIAPANIPRATFLPNGNVGIGISNPAYKFEVDGRMRLRHNVESAGIWFNNSSNTSSPGFVGMATDNEVGLYGSSGAGWALRMNTTSGRSTFSNEVYANAYKYNNPITHYYSMGNADFSAHNGNKPRTSDDYYWYPQIGAYNTFSAPVHLPDGAIVTSVILYAYDGSATEDLNMFLAFSSVGNSSGESLVLINTSGSPGYATIINSTIANPVINNQARTYYIYLVSTGGWGSDALRVKSIVISYTLTGPQ